MPGRGVRLDGWGLACKYYKYIELNGEKTGEYMRHGTYCFIWCWRTYGDGSHGGEEGDDGETHDNKMAVRGMGGALFFMTGE